MAGKKNINQQDDIEDEDESGDGGERLPATDDENAIWIPSFYDSTNITRDDELERLLAEDALFAIRLGVKSQKVEVTALTKVQEQLNKKRHEFNNDAGPGGSSGPNLEKHPELEDANGAAPDNIVFPESEELAIGAASNNPKLQHKLKQKLANRFGMSSGGMSEQAMRDEYKKKMQAKMKMQVPGPSNKYKNRVDKPAHRPKLTPH